MRGRELCFWKAWGGFGELCVCMISVSGGSRSWRPKGIALSRLKSECLSGLVGRHDSAWVGGGILSFVVMEIPPFLLKSYFSRVAHASNT